jgi:putative tryptophan/tyrosine transport system substrate-binding protein
MTHQRLKILILVLILLTTMSIARAQETLDWFNLLPSAAERWALTLDPADPLRFTLEMVDNSAVATAPEKHILLLFTRPSSSYDVAVAKIGEIFMDKGIKARFTAINFLNDPALAQTALDFAAAEDVDLIFSIGSDTTDTIYKMYNGGQIPVVTVTSKDPVLMGYLKDYETGSGTNIAYTSLNVPIELQMIYLKQLIPDLANIAVMYADSNSSAKQTQVEPLREIARDYNINILDVVVMDDANAQAELAQAMPTAIDQIDGIDPEHTRSIFWITGSTSVFNEIETINRMAGDIPVLSAVPNVVTEGENSAVLSIGVTFESNAHLAALFASDILDGSAKPGDLSVGVVSPPDIAINFMKATEIGLKIPFSFFESASYVYDYNGALVREAGQPS